MRVYLLDTNIWRFWFDNNPKIVTKMEGLSSGSRIVLSSIVWGEIVYGARRNPKFPFEEYSQFIRANHHAVFSVDKHVSEVYGEMRNELFKQYASKKRRWPEQLIDPATSHSLGIQENDLWLVSQALTYDLKFITNDKKMQRIFSVTSSELSFEIWDQ